MFLYYREQSKSVNSVTEFLTSMGLLIWKKFDYNIIDYYNINYNIIDYYNINYNIIDYYNIDYNIIVCVLLFLLLITVLKNSK